MARLQSTGQDGWTDVGAGEAGGVSKHNQLSVCDPVLSPELGNTGGGRGFGR